MRRQRQVPFPERHSFRIAGLSIRVTSADLPLAEERVPSYLPFVVPEGGPVPDLTIDLNHASPSLPAGSRPLFESGECCSVHTWGSKLLVAPHRDHPGARPDWLAVIDEDRKGVRVTCGDPMVVGIGAQARLFSPFHYPLDQIVLSLALAGEGLIVHAAGIEFGPGGLVVAGVSGAGKTTISGFCAADALAVLSDDRVIIRRTPDGWRLFGTPWPGEGRFAENRGVELRGVALLRKGGENRIRPLAAGDLAKGLLPLASIPWYDRLAAGRCLDLVEELVAGIRGFEFTFRPERAAASALAEILG